MDELRIRHTRLRKRIGGAKVLDDALVNHRRDVFALTRHGIAVRRARLVMAHLVERRYIGATDRRELLDNLGTRGALIA